MKYAIHKVLKHFFVILFSFSAFGFQIQTAIAQTFQPGDVFVAISNGQVQWRSSTGTLIKTLNTGLGGFTTGMAFDKTGNLYVTNFSSNSISKFNNSGILQGTFGSGYSTPESIVFDETGNAYVGNTGSGIRKYSPTGDFISTSFAGRTDWIDLAADQCTVFRTDEGTYIGRHNVCTNTALSNLAVGLGGSAFALRIRKNGEVMLANGLNVLRLSAAGTVLQTYDVTSEDTWFALNLDPNGTSFYSANFGTANVYKIDIATGNVIQTFNTGTGGNTVFGLAVFGEFTVSVCANNIAPSFVAPSPTCGSAIPATVGSPLSFTVKASDPNTGDIITLNATGLPAASTMTPALPTNGSPVSSVFSWTPASTDVGPHVVTFSAVDKCGSKVECSYTINVTNTTSSNVYYSKPTGDLHNVLTWGVNADGSGANPPDFTAGKTFNLANRSSGIYTMTGDWTVGGIINIPSGSQLQINGKTLSEAALTGTGTLTGSQSSNLMVTGSTGGDAGTLLFTSGGDNLNSLALNRSGASASATIGTTLNVFGVLTVQSGMLNTGGLLTLKSNAANTARVAPVTGSISGNVTVERYIPARRAWRLMDAPVMGSQTISQAWQEGATTASATPNPHPGYGTHITGGPVYGSLANGFDQHPGSNSSLKTYNSTTNTWDPVHNTNATLVGTTPYMLFVRGDRGIHLDGPHLTPTNTTLRATGALNIGDQTFPVSATGFTAIPNPFASPINYATITRNNVQNNFYLWDPKLGGTYGVGAYVNVSWNGSSYDVTPSAVSPESQYIQSGQSFLVHSTGAAGSLTIKESDKSATAATNVFCTAGSSNSPTSSTSVSAQSIKDGNVIQGLRINMQTINEDHSASLLDEVFTSYSNQYSDNIDAMDAVKIPNLNENLSIVRNGQNLMVERRSMVAANDTISLKVWNMEQHTYLLEFNPIHLASTMLSTSLVDNYLHTVTPVDLTKVTQRLFTVTTEAASANANRFMVVLSSTAAQPMGTITGRSAIMAYPNPISGKTLSVQLVNQPKGAYRVMVVNSIGQEVFQGKIDHAGGSATHILQLGSKLATGVYQLRVINAGTTSTLKIMSN